MKREFLIGESDRCFPALTAPERAVVSTIAVSAQALA